jgi:hypothetical protein
MKKGINCEIKERRSINCDLMDFCYLSKPGDFIEITEWVNLDGYDITISEKQFSLTHGELKALKKLIKILDKS